VQENQSIAAAWGHFHARRLPEAEAICRSLLTQNPRDAEALHLLGVIAGMVGKRDAAEGLLHQAAQLRPESGDILAALGTTLFQRDRLREAEQIYDRALQLNPDNFIARHNMAVIQQRVGNFPASAAHFTRATQLAPDHALARLNLGAVLRDLDRIDESIAHLEQALRIDPSMGHAHMQLAWNRLLHGEFDRGWQEYEWRWRCPGAKFPQFAQPLWDGTPLAGRTIMLHAEQGLGDSIQFVRYAALLARQGGRVIVYCPQSLQTLLATAPGVAEAVGDARKLGAFDCWCPMLSLPLRFGTNLLTIPRDVPYLSADSALVAKWAQLLGGDLPGLRIGLCWAGNRANYNDVNRSIPLELLAPLGRVSGSVFYSLQVGADAPAKPPFAMIDRTSSIRDFADTAALVSQLDLVISVDTAVAHLAGALAKPVWLLVPFAPDWRWLLERPDSPWYPTMRIFRKRPMELWPEMIEKVAGTLRCVPVTRLFKPC
jgi:Tfp pilus assembly protein PilF